MSSIAISGIVFAFLFGGALLGLWLRRALPDHHLSAEAKETIKLGIGLIGTMGALVLGLMVASAKGSYDTQKSELTQMTAKVIVLDRVLTRYGPETKEARAALRDSVARVLARIWPEDSSRGGQFDPRAASGEIMFEKIHELSPKNEAQRTLQTQATSVAMDISQTAWLLFQQAGSAISTAFLVVVVFWLTLIFASFGMFAPANTTVLATLLLCALSVAGAIFLILELDRPFDGFIQISSAPMRNTLAQLGH
ncbi:MAG: DUF4239 domain-containing protein [Planctomycetes bacterium]|nr:DUF4239 domain-containing protein [Planctomycetota bacterium]